MKELLLIIAIVVSVCIVVFTATKIDERDRAVLESADLYEACVRDQYGMSPSRWKIEQGEYPVCNIKIK